MQGGQQAERQHCPLLGDAVVGQVQQNKGGEAARLCTQNRDGILLIISAGTKIGLHCLCQRWDKRTSMKR